MSKFDSRYQSNYKLLNLPKNILAKDFTTTIRTYSGDAIKVSLQVFGEIVNGEESFTNNSSFSMYPACAVGEPYVVDIWHTTTDEDAAVTLANALINFVDFLKNKYLNKYFSKEDFEYFINRLTYITNLSIEFDILLNEQLAEDTVKKRSGKWVNRGADGDHGEFTTKKQADAQRKAMFANGYKG